MKSAAFAYHAPAAVGEAAALLAAHGERARVLAGGQSLVPLMHRRIERPEHLVDLNRVAGLDRLEAGPEGLRIGATARQRQVESDPAVAARWPLLAEAIAEVAHPAIRNRGTVVGSLCNADPSAELPSAALALEGTIVAAGADGEREIPLADFFTGPGETALSRSELALELRLPAPPPRTGSAWLELARRGGDLPVAGVAAVVSLDADGRCERVRLVCANAAPVPLDCRFQAEALLGAAVDEEGAAAVGAAVAAAAGPVDDYQGSAVERRRVLAVLVRRALLLAAERAGGRS
ncbi:MAG: FAD binding domain-containing protein [Actinobacteria bacterium]|nr:FAD binding domain-containing protein [Actinomycetota bacterium]